MRAGHPICRPRQLSLRGTFRTYWRLENPEVVRRFSSAAVSRNREGKLLPVSIQNICRRKRERTSRKSAGRKHGVGYDRRRTVRTSIVAPGVHQARFHAAGGLQAGCGEGTDWEEENLGADLLYVYKSQTSVIEQAIETAALMLVSYNARVLLRDICADFLAVAHLDRAIPRSCYSISHYTNFLPCEQHRFSSKPAREARPKSLHRSSSLSA